MNSFSKSKRLLSKKEYDEVYRYRNRFTGVVSNISFSKKFSENPKLGLAVSKKYGNAVQRNRVKRLVREYFRQNYESFICDFSLSMRVSKRKPIAIDIEKTLLEDLEGFIQYSLKKIKV